MAGISDGSRTGQGDGRRIVRRRRMHEDLVEMLATDICDGVYPVGDCLPSERALMEEFGVSRLTVREATAALEARGLIETRPGSRARVCGPRTDFLLTMLSQTATFYLRQPGGLTSFSEVRQLVETGVVRLAAQRATKQDIQDLKERLDANRAAIGDTAQFGATDMEFHAAIAAIVGNPILSGFFRALDRWLQEVRTTSLRLDGQTETAYRAHVEIYEAIAAKDPDRADRAMRHHLEQLQSIYPEALAADADKDSAA
ncbi:GntR family transcriptional regulator [Limimaricola soesokkakensis]|uniref:GntR family transcriptional regulator n=1 Tax=Limimaricola soesokkakensis TaxID=1343159 RepID=A0A1X6YTC9_9RHOB|nr:FCD domain-containing protein [Limimaricola soesokkakensis]PSK87544.1 GntR family transcriptional regulator [Limimaricola soesokkakensis]SLN30928.1 HTH-type transcriptional regulator LutR [Limimaricola soesokkakensis]